MHSAMAFKLCDAILSELDSERAKLYCRILPELEVSAMSESSLGELKEELTRVYREVRVKQLKNFVDKALTLVKERLPDAKVEAEDVDKNEDADFTGLKDATEVSSQLDLLEETMLPPERRRDVSPGGEDANEEGEASNPKVTKKKRTLRTKNQAQTTLRTPALRQRERNGSEDGSLGTTPVRRSRRIKSASASVGTENLPLIREDEDSH